MDICQIIGVYNNFDELYDATIHPEIQGNRIGKQHENFQALKDLDKEILKNLFVGFIKEKYNLPNEHELLRVHCTKGALREYFIKEGYLSDMSFPREFWESYYQKIEVLDNQFAFKRLISADDAKAISYLKPGTTVIYDPQPANATEAFRYLTDYYAHYYFELEKLMFLENCQVYNKLTVEDKIRELDVFIDKAKEHSSLNAAAAFGKYGNNNEFVYKRIEAGYYQNLKLDKYPSISSLGNPEAVVYGKYVLFYNFLKQQLQEKEQLSLFTNTDDACEVTVEEDVSNEGPKVISLASIFKKKEYYDLCLTIFKEFNVIDDNNECKLTTGKGNILFAIIDAFKSRTDKNALLDKEYTDKELLNIFNNHLKPKHPFVQIKRDSKGFIKCLPEIREFIRNSNVAPSS